MEISANRKTLAGKYRLKVEELACADLVACGWSISDAWSMCMRVGLTWTGKALKDEQVKLMSRTGFNERMNETKGALFDSKRSSHEEVKKRVKVSSIKDSVSKDALIADLIAARQGMSPNSKDYIEATMKIADLTNAKKEESKVEEKLIHYHLPLKCSMCELKRANDLKNGRKK